MPFDSLGPIPVAGARNPLGFDLPGPSYPKPSGGAISVTDGGTTVDPASSVDFTSGATVTDGGGGIAQVAVTGGAIVYPLTAPVNAVALYAGVANEGFGFDAGGAPKISANNGTLSFSTPSDESNAVDLSRLSNATGNGGAINLRSGNGGSGAFDGGEARVFAGGSGGGATGNGGGVTLIAGDSFATSGDGGNINLIVGNKAGAGLQGAVSIIGGLFFPNLPGVPGASGSLYSNAGIVTVSP